MGKVGEVSLSVKQKHPKNRKTKFILKFDEAKREEFLNGFHKRKVERRKRAEEELKKKLEEEKKERRRQLRELRRQQQGYKPCEPIRNIEKLAASKTYELPSHTVTVTDVTDIDFVGTGGLMLGINQDNVSDHSSHKTETQVLPSDVKLAKGKPLKAKDILGKSKLSKKVQILKKKGQAKKKGKKKPRKKPKKKH